MKITRTEFRAMPHKVEDTIKEVVCLPGWLVVTYKQSCDCCHFPINTSDTLSSLRLESGNVMLIHSECLQRLTAAN